MSKDSKSNDRPCNPKDLLELLVARAIVDSEFRNQLLSDKESVAKEYQIQGEDLAILRKIDADLLESTRHAAAMIPVVHLRSSKE
ncbi:hypothetical protein [Vibrio parahaemolyticus]|uniref:hypothetical protein n=1 Tax=Vibrio parahaemolyticus TaxID=670 RepID=UPI0011222305|nr:hypothetical protein [Vibrio parahaemolyticus]MCC4210097.1 hypothetical protein [Vibrio parahaemolyticus]TOE40991.1 hypothetical protein CGJ45_13255 [Vibrio parahaemolyticus]